MLQMVVSGRYVSLSMEATSLFRLIDKRPGIRSALQLAYAEYLTMQVIAGDIEALEHTEYAGAEGSFAGNHTFRCGPYLLHSPTARMPKKVRLRNRNKNRLLISSRFSMFIILSLVLNEHVCFGASPL